MTADVIVMRRSSLTHPIDASNSARPFRSSPSPSGPPRPSLDAGPLPPIGNLVAFYFDACEKKKAGSSTRTAPGRLSNSPNARSELLADGPDNTYMLCNDHDYQPPLRNPYGGEWDGEWDGEREREQREHDERSSQVPRGYSIGLPFSMTESAESTYADGATAGSVGSSPPSSSAYSNMADGDWFPLGQQRRPAPHSIPPSSEWDRAQDARRHADAPYHPGHSRAPLPPPARMVDGYQQQHSSRVQSLSTSSTRSFDRAAFPLSAASSAAAAQADQRLPSRPSSFLRSPPEYYASSDFRNRGPSSSQGSARGSSGPGSAQGPLFGVSGCRIADSKQRKRRGNLPKETTDKLRAWFSEHLHHPYPTEDEKQELMHQTGLQMNQISNWFINARRRHLPALINNARAVEGAISNGRGATSSTGNMPGSMTGAGIDTMRSNGTAGMAPGGVHQKGFLSPSEHIYAPSSSRIYGSFDRPREPGSSSLYSQSNPVDQRHISPSSDDDY